MQNEINISLVLATYKRPDTLLRTLESFTCLKCDALNWDIWVVDNAGDPATEAVVKKFAEKLPINYLVEIKNGKNHALNRAIQEVTGNLIVFTDDDIIADPKWLDEMWNGANRWTEASIFGGRILPILSNGKMLDLQITNFIKSAYGIADWDINEGIYSAEMVWGGNMAIRSNIFKDGWTFDTNIGPDGSTSYIMGSETEFTRRLEKSGYKCVFLPEALVFHQIRDEQLSHEWLCNRAFRKGRGAALSVPKDITKIMGVPRYLIKVFIIESMKYVNLLFFKDSSNALNKKIEINTIRGTIYQCYLNWKA